MAVMRDKVTDDERRYIKENILDPISKDMDKLHLFGDMNRGKIMLETSIQRLNFDKAKYEVKLDIFREMNDTGWQISVSARPKDCDDNVGISARISQTEV